MMTNKEWYKRAFSSLHTSPDFMVQLENRKTAKWLKKWAFVGAFMVLIIGTSTIYAANIGGIQRTIQIWIHGELTDATLTIDENNGTYSIKDPNGKAIQSGGGVAIDTQGHSRALTPEEIMEDQENMVSTEKIDGHMYLYYKDQKYDITNPLAHNTYTYITLRDSKKTLYITVVKSGGVATSEDRYVLPDEFSCN